MKYLKKAMVLGGTSPHISLIEKLKNRGYYTILIDYYKNPPAKKVADEHIQASTLDQEEVLKLATINNIDLIISACVDQANLTACYVGEKLYLPIPYSYQTAINVTNKVVMKKMMLDAGIPTAKHFYVENVISVTNKKINYPVMVKPADSCGSSGVKKAKNLHELKIYVKDALNISRSKQAVVEEFKEGIEVSVYAFIVDGKANILMISQRYSVNDNNEVIRCYATLAPAFISNEARNSIASILENIAKHFSLNNTPIHLQAIINGDDICIIEFAPRVGGGVSYKTIQINTDFDIIEATIDSYLGRPVKVENKSPMKYISVNIIYAQEGLYGCTTGYDKLLEDNTITEVFEYKTPGMKITTDKASGSRVGSFIIKSDNIEELICKTKRSMDKLEVLDENGNSIMRKDAFLTRSILKG